MNMHDGGNFAALQQKSAASRTRDANEYAARRRRIPVTLARVNRPAARSPGPEAVRPDRN
jgi:hypothetical protein